MLFLAFVVLASPFVAQSSSTCSSDALQGASDSGECLLQPHVTSNAFQNSVIADSIITEENAEDEDHDFGEEDELEDEDDAEPAEEEAALQLGAGDTTQGIYFDGRCYNWFGNGMKWSELKAMGLAEHKAAGVWGTFLNSSLYPNVNVCSWDTTSGMDFPDMELSYYCGGKINGKIAPCKSTTIKGKNGGGIRVDCVNGLCADATNVNGDWSRSYRGVTCNTKKIAPILKLKSPKGNPQLSKWNPTCKVMCESTPGCTGFTVHTIRRRPQCRFFGADHPSTASADGYEKWKAECGTARRCCNQKKGCCNHPHYTTYFLTRK